MSRPIVIGWLAPDTAAISALQTVLAGQKFIINGTLAGNVPPNPWVSFIELLQTRTVSITSAGDNSAVSFTITGTYRNAIVSEVLAGPTAAGTVYTTQLFDTVTSIVPDINTVGDVSIGSGTTGHTDWMLYDFERALNTCSFQVVVSGTINYSLQCTLDDVQNIANPFVFDATGGTLTNQTVSNVGTASISTFQYSCIAITDVGGEIPVISTGSLVLTYIEQGTR